MVSVKDISKRQSEIEEITNSHLKDTGKTLLGMKVIEDSSLNENEITIVCGEYLAFFKLEDENKTG